MSLRDVVFYAPFGRCYLFLFFALIFLLPRPSLASEQDIVINEIAAYEASDYEWIEIYNKGAEKIDITGWKFFESATNHKLTVFRGDFVIDPGEYAIIANDAAKIATKYPGFTGTILDSSWSSLSEKGEEIGLKNAKSATVELFTYGAHSKGSLERKDATLLDYTSANWKEYVGKNTIGAKNSNSVPLQESQSGTPSQQQNSESQTEPPPPVWIPGRSDVLINELVSDPEEGDKEWIELYNPTRHEIELSGWTLEDGSRNSVMLSGTLGTQDLKRFFVRDLPAGFLRNSGDSISLRDARMLLIDEVVYGDWDDGDILNNAPRATDPQSLARAGDGTNTFNNKSDFQATVTPTKGGSNRITQSPDTTPIEKKISLIISELLPNPSSQNPKDEFIELFNAGDEPVNLEGWALSCTDGRSYVFQSTDFASLVVAPSAYFIVPRQISNLVLRNKGGDRVRLSAPNVDHVYRTLAYQDNALLGMSYSFAESGSYLWSQTPTPGKKNTITTRNQPSDIILDADDSGIVGEFMTFDASDSRDADSKVLEYTWDFGDWIYASGAVVNHTYVQPGTYILVLTVGDGKERTAFTKKITISSHDTSNANILSPVFFRPGVSVHGGQRGKPIFTPKNDNKIVIDKKNTIAKKQPQFANSLHDQALMRIRTLPTGTHVTVRGIVSVEPGVVSESYFYIAGSGIQIWNPKKLFPKLHRGDRVLIAGTLKKNGEELAIGIADPANVHVDATGEEPTPHEVTVKDIGESYEGWLVRLSAVVQKVQWPNITIGDDSGQVRIYIAKTTQIPHLPIEKGETLTVEGIVSQTKTGFRILPRDIHDIVLAQKDSQQKDDMAQPEVKPEKTAKSEPIRRYLFVLFVAFVVIAGGLFLEHLHRQKELNSVDRKKSD